METNPTLWQRSKPFRLLLGWTWVVLALTLWGWPYLPAADSGAYFDFADQRTWLGIPHFGDVVSNAAFLAVGLYGLWLAYCQRQWSASYRIIGAVLAGGCLLTAAGSTYFHLIPNPATLFWDRLPMTTAFTAVVALMIADRVDERLGLWCLALLVPLGALSVIGYSQGWLTLRPYIAVQFGGILYAVLIAALKPQGRVPNRILYAAFALYALAKGLEVLDDRVFDLAGGLISGHTVKHLFAALGAYRVLTFLREK